MTYEYLGITLEHSFSWTVYSKGYRNYFHRYDYNLPCEIYKSQTPRRKIYHVKIIEDNFTGIYCVHVNTHKFTTM